jgi:phenylpropionate dioxygenase-like ring-hydroxylating dioxygenase large terminal subunit
MIVPQVKETVRPMSNLADENTLLVRDAWYVAAFSRDLVAGKIFARKIAGERVLLYRKRDGAVVALKDRCPHRSFPLSAGFLEEDDVVCGYHGMRFAPDGRCVKVPSQPTVPRAMAARSYPVVEEAPVIWIWVGNKDIAATTPLPSQDWFLERGGWAAAHSYLHVRASYVHLHENLMDLSHLTFLHSRTFGTPDYAKAPFETEVNDRAIAVRRIVSPTLLPPIYAEPLKMTNKEAARIVTSTMSRPVYRSRPLYSAI